MDHNNKNSKPNETLAHSTEPEETNTVEMDETEILINQEKVSDVDLNDAVSEVSENIAETELLSEPVPPPNPGDDSLPKPAASTPIDPDEPTESLVMTTGQNKIKQKNYLILSSIIGVLVIGLVCFFIYTQMQTTQINKALELGENYLEEGKYEEAILAFDKVLIIDEKAVAAYEGKGASYLGLDDYVHAEEQLETAKTITFSDNGKILMADVYLNTNRKDEGIKLAEEVAANDPENTKTVIRLGDFYTQIAEYNKVIGLLEKRIALTTDPVELKKLYDELIPAYVKAGKSEEEMLELLERATKATGDESYLAKKDTYLVKKPSFKLAPGEYAGTQNLEIIKGNPGDKVYYTLDGSCPTQASPEYTSLIPLGVGEVIVKVMEVNPAGVSAPPVEGKYVIKKTALSDAEFIDALYGGWYTNNGGRYMIFGRNQFAIGKPYTDAAHTGSYSIETLTENGGRIIVNGRMMDKNLTAYQVPIDFDFGTPGDNCVNVSIDNSEWAVYTLGTDLGNNQYSIPYPNPKEPSLILTIN